MYCSKSYIEPLTETTRFGDTTVILPFKIGKRYEDL